MSGASRSQTKIALRLQLGDPHHAATLGDNEARSKSFSATFCEFEARPGELPDALRKIGIGGRRMKCPQRLAVNHQRDRDMVGTADAVEMVLSTLSWARQASARRRRQRRR